LMVSSLLNIAYLIPIPVRGFLFAPPEGPERPPIREAPAFCVIPLCVTALGCVVLFFFAEELYALLGPLVLP
ncbi:MAG: monovalent cation/H+ antiporter subunit D family protein, partial [Gemmatimonadota bacterium]|nr:monovalent cation/H+ antiporter subunit D family protein [Gemmatimonadota bacterium]